MNLILENNLKNNLSAIKAEIAQYDALSKVEFFNYCINDKLKSTLYRYNIETDQLSDFLIRQKCVRVLKAITKIQKFDDKKIIQDNMKGDNTDD